MGCVLIRKGRETRALSVHPVKTQGEGEKAVPCKPERGPSPRTRSAGTLTLDFSDSGL